MKYIAMIRTADGSISEIEAHAQGLDAARSVVPEGGQLMSVRTAE